MVKTFSAGSRSEWREWLRRNHKKETKVSLVVNKKHTGKPSLSHREAMEEAICFGWIDTTIKRLDDNRFIRNFSRRNSKSRWSQNTQGYARELIRENRMAKAGMEAYLAGLKIPTHDHNVPKNPEVPLELKNALEKDNTAKKNFYSFAPSYRRMYLVWLHSAKRKETRDKRIKEIVSRAKNNRKLFG